MSDKSKLELLKEGDSRYLTSLYKEVLPTIISWMTNNNGGRDDAYDVFQDALEALIHKAYKSDPDADMNVEGLLVQIAKNKWIDKLRRKKYDTKVRSLEVKRYNDEYSAEPEIIAVEEEQEKQKLLSMTFAKLSDKCQQLLKMIMAESPTEEIVKKLDMTNANTMYRRKHACMKSWKTYIDDSGYNSYEH